MAVVLRASIAAWTSLVVATRSPLTRIVGLSDILSIRRPG